MRTGVVAAVCVLVLASAASADSWMPPTTEAYLSADKATRLTIVPRDLESTLAYFEDKVDGRPNAGRPASATATSAQASIERQGSDGRWSVTWAGPLVNEIAPTDAIIANGGERFATFDNWYSTGYGADAIVIYGANGRLVRKLALTDLFPDWYVAMLPHSVSSIHWRRDAKLSVDGATLTLSIVRPSANNGFDQDEHTDDLAIRMADGAPVGLDSPSWDSRRRAAAVLARAACADARESIRENNAPVAAPRSAEERDWHYYLRQAFWRTHRARRDISTDTTVLRVPNAPDYAASREWLSEALSEEALTTQDARSIGSPDEANLVAEIERISEQVPPGRLAGVDLYIVASSRGADRVRAALARSRATLTILDPKQALPQPREGMMREEDWPECHAPTGSPAKASWWMAAPFLLIGAALIFLRRRP